MNKIPNRQAICEVLMEKVKEDKDIVVLCSDSRGSASLTPFAASPASFLSTRSYEQCKVDVSYSNTNVTLIGISGGVSYGALGMSHHSAQDIAAMSAIPNMRVYLPSDRFQTVKLVEALLKDEKPAYIRVGRNAVEDVYTQEDCPFEMDQATVLGEGTDAALIACGEMVRPAYEAAALLKEKGISVTVLDMYCVKPLDRDAVIKAAQNAKVVVTMEGHGEDSGRSFKVMEDRNGQICVGDRSEHSRHESSSV